MINDDTLTKMEMEALLTQKGPTYRTMLTYLEAVIKKRKLPWKIENDKVIEVGDSTEAWLSRFITSNVAMEQLKEDVRKLAKIDTDKDQLFTVLIRGETGTGKELIAQALHGDRAGKFLGINCAGLPSELVESELFGHLQGAFTGATRTKEGLMKACNKGTLFLDEIGELPLPAQAKLLRAIQSKRIRKVGSDVDEEISCRMICATHRDLQAMHKEEKFRTDLFARISTFELHTLPLSDRYNDIIPIVEAMDGGKEFLLEYMKTKTVHDLDLTYNVRSLQRYIKRFKALGRLP